MSKQWRCVVVSSGAQPRLKSWGRPRFGSQHWALAQHARRIAPPAVRVRGYQPRKIFENSDAKSCILVLISGLPRTCNFLLTAKTLRGTNTPLVPQPKSWGGPVSPGPYGCCAYDLTTVSKVIEQMVLARLRPNLLASLSFARLHVQSAYRRGHSTDTSLLHVMNSVYAAADEAVNGVQLFYRNISFFRFQWSVGYDLDLEEPKSHHRWIAQSRRHTDT